MKKSHLAILTLLTSILFLSFSIIKTASVTDYLNVGEKIIFNGKEYKLAWSSNPTDNYFKQEYLPDSATIFKHNDMLLVEAIKGDLTAEDAMKLKVVELEKWKKTNPVINYLVHTKDDDHLIDFVISDGAYIYEWNLYRYINQKGKDGNYSVLYAYTYRDSLNTNDDLIPFFTRVKENREDYINKLGKLKLPKVKTE